MDETATMERWKEAEMEMIDFARLDAIAEAKRIRDYQVGRIAKLEAMSASEYLEFLNYDPFAEEDEPQ